MAASASFFAAFAGSAFSLVSIVRLVSAVRPFGLPPADPLLFDVSPQYRCQDWAAEKSQRAKCDDRLFERLRPLLAPAEEGAKPAMSMYTSLDDEAFQEAWQCYAADPCYMVPEGPTSLLFAGSRTAITAALDSDPPGPGPAVGQLNNGTAGAGPGTGLRQVSLPWVEGRVNWEQEAADLHWYSFMEWHTALLNAVSTAMEAMKSDAIYLAIHVGSPGSSGDGFDVADSNSFNRSVQKRYNSRDSRLFYKSELWTLVHVLNAFGWDSEGGSKVKGVIWLQGRKIAEIPEPALGAGSAVLLPFDATYSGRQLAQTTGQVVRRINNPEVKVYVAVGIAKKTVLELGDDDVELQIYNELKLGVPPTDAAAARQAVLSRCTVITGLVAGPRFALQFKVPDSISLDTPFALLLRCALCCFGESVRREPYKVYTERTMSKEECAGIPSTSRDPVGFSCACDEDPAASPAGGLGRMAKAGKAKAGKAGCDGGEGCAAGLRRWLWR